MKVSVLLLFALVMIVALSSVDGGWWRRTIRRIRLRRICNSVCKTVCSRKCGKYGCVDSCKPVCTSLCGKRSLPEINARSAEENLQPFIDNDAHDAKRYVEDDLNNIELFVEDVDSGTKRDVDDGSDTKRYVEDEDLDNTGSVNIDSGTKRDVDNEGSFSGNIDTLKEE